MKIINSKLEISFGFIKKQYLSREILSTNMIYLFNILETHPWLTLNCLDMTHGRTPAAAISIIFSLMWFGSGRPFMKTPPNWLTLPCPMIEIEFHIKIARKNNFLHSGIKSLIKRIENLTLERITTKRHWSHHIWSFIIHCCEMIMS